MKATQTNMEESERETSEQEKDSDDQPRLSELVPKRGATSIKWTWFGFEKSDTDQKNVFCKVCRKLVSAPDSNTTNLFYHLRKNHEKQYGESLRMKSTKAQSPSAQNKPQTVQEAFARGTPYDKDSRRWKEITAAIAIYICKDMAPIYTVEKQEFVSWCEHSTQGTQCQAENTSLESSCLIYIKSVWPK